IGQTNWFSVVELVRSFFENLSVLCGFLSSVREFRRIFRRNENEALFSSFPVLACPVLVRLCANEEGGDEEGSRRPRARQSPHAENLGRVVHPRSGQRRQVLRHRPAYV